jgi:hypothetical protein
MFNRVSFGRLLGLFLVRELPDLPKKDTPVPRNPQDWGLGGMQEPHLQVGLLEKEEVTPGLPC